MRAILAFALCLLATPALADCGIIIMPPAQFNHPLAYDPTIHLMNYWALDRFCRGKGVVASTGARVEACSVAAARTMWLPSGVSAERQKCYFIHERGHLEGWTSRHEGGRYE